MSSHKTSRQQVYAFSSAGIPRLPNDKLDDDCFSVKTLECSDEDGIYPEEDKASIEDKSPANLESPRLGKRDLGAILETRSNNSRTNIEKNANIKNSKNNIVTIKIGSQEWIYSFRIQERERYRNPT